MPSGNRQQVVTDLQNLYLALRQGLPINLTPAMTQLLQAFVTSQTSAPGISLGQPGVPALPSIATQQQLLSSGQGTQLAQQMQYAQLAMPFSAFVAKALQSGGAKVPQPSGPPAAPAAVGSSVGLAGVGVGGGGGGIGGGGGAGTGIAGPPPVDYTAGPAGDANIRSNFPQYAWLLSIPNAYQFMHDAASSGDPATYMDTHLGSQQWYQDIGPNFFNLIQNEAQNPSAAASTMQEEMASVRQTFTQLGLQPTDQQLQTFAYQALAQDWQAHPELEQQAIAGTVQANADGTFSVKNFTVDPGSGKLVDTFVGPTGQVSVDYHDFQTTLDPSYIQRGFVTSVGTVAGPGGQMANSPGWITGAPVYAMVGSQLQMVNPADMAAGTQIYTLPNFVGVQGQAQAGAPSTMTGELQTLEQAYKATAADYMVPTSDQGAAQYVAQLVGSGLQGTAINDQLKTYFQTQAKSLYPTMAAAIDAGITPKAYTAPYQAVAAQLLGVPPDSINMMDPKYIRAVTQKDPKTGMPTAMSLFDWQQTLMSDPTYNYTSSQNAKDRASSLAQGIAEMFGRSASGPAGSTAFNAAGAPAISGAPIL